MIRFVGSSSVSVGSPLPRLLASRLGREAEPIGVVGSRVSAWAARFRSGDVPAPPAGLSGVVVYLGANDARPPEVADVGEVDAGARAWGAPVVWLPPPEYPPSSLDAGGRPMAGRGAAMRSALASVGARFVGVRFELSRGLLRADGVHPTRAGYSRWSDAVSRELSALLRSPAAPPSGTGSAAFPVIGAACLALLLKSG